MKHTHYRSFQTRYSSPVGRFHEAYVRLSSPTKEKDRAPILDAGCGFGELELFIEAISCDVNRQALRYAKSICKNESEFILASLLHLPFQDETFSAIAMLDVLEHVRREATLLKNCLNVLKTDGFMLITVPLEIGIANIFDIGYFKLRHKHYSECELLKLLKKLGFHNISFCRRGSVLEYFFGYFVASLDRTSYAVGAHFRTLTETIYHFLYKHGPLRSQLVISAVKNGSKINQMQKPIMYQGMKNDQICGKRWSVEAPMVSVVIPTFNSEKTLTLCLQSIKDQTYPNVEVIVVDNYSQDNTVRIAKEFHARVLLLASERSSARNLGIKEALSAFIFSVDSDMELTPKVIEECISACLQKKVDALIIPELSVGRGFLAECRKMEKEMRIEHKFLEAPRFFRREVLHSVSGFDENLVVGEEFDLARRIEEAGYTMGRVKGEIKHHEGELSMRRIALKAYHYGKTMPAYIRKSTLFSAKTSYPIRYFRSSKLVREHPIHLIGLIIVKLIEYVAYLIGILFGLLESDSVGTWQKKKLLT